MKKLRYFLVTSFARALGVPVKVREEFFGAAKGCS